MRIISKFHDYYDSISNIGGHDNTIIYNRETDIIQCPSPVTFKSFSLTTCFHSPFKEWDLCDFSITYIVFCGKLYASMHYYHKKPNTFHYKWNCVQEWEKLCADEKYKYRYTTMNLARLIDEIKRQKDYTQINLECGSPILLWIPYQRYEPKNCTINPMLSQYDFASAVEPYTAFQTLEQFVDNHFTRKVEMIELDNATRIAKHGFDKWSFRNEPQK